MRQVVRQEMVKGLASDLVETAIEQLLNLRTLKGDSLELCLVVVVEEGQGLSTIYEPVTTSPNQQF